MISATYPSPMDAQDFAAAPRGTQIWSDVLRRKSTAWPALDDDYLEWRAWHRENLVRTDPVLGSSEPGVLEGLKTKLELMCDTRV